MERTTSLKREPELKLEGRLECQPEYRKAYIDYIKRERMERLSRPIENLNAPKPFLRAYDVFNNDPIVSNSSNKAPNKESS